MEIVRLDHVNIRTTRLDEMVNWYTDVLGLRIGFRPNFPFGGAWLYAGEIAVVHLIQIDEASAIGSEASLKLEHFALRANGQSKFEERLKKKNEKYSCVELTDANLVLYNIWDPDGNHLHVDFALADSADDRVAS